MHRVCNILHNITINLEENNQNVMCLANINKIEAIGTRTYLMICLI